MLNPQQRAQLLEIARRSVEAVLHGQAPRITPPDDPELTRRSGAFVTLTMRGDLRGCIGSIEAAAPLWKTVSDRAVSAAFQDPRFEPLDRSELDRIEIEISVMSPIEKVKAIDEIEVGRDGLIISSRDRAGLLLPQVATEYGWDRETFLRQTCVKAGLPTDEWQKPGCLIERFSAEVFGESDHPRQ